MGFGSKHHHYGPSDEYEHIAAILSIVITAITILGSVIIIIRCIRSIRSKRISAGSACLDQCERQRGRSNRLFTLFRFRTKSQPGRCKKGGEAEQATEEKISVVEKRKVGGAKRLRGCLIIGLMFSDAWVG